MQATADLLYCLNCRTLRHYSPCPPAATRGLPTPQQQQQQQQQLTLVAHWQQQRLPLLDLNKSSRVMERAAVQGFGVQGTRRAGGSSGGGSSSSRQVAAAVEAVQGVPVLMRMMR
jgi:hypothetical protein